MAKFALECPYCTTANTVSIFNKIKGSIKCGSCGEEINIKANRLASSKCPNCDSVFLYDQLKGINKCPACHSKININKIRYGKLVSFLCPQCGCVVQFDEHTDSKVSCPVCDCQIDVKKEIGKSRLVSDTGISVIKYEGDNETFIWKHPIEDFNLGSQLIVHESQEAVFFLDGQALDIFGPGRYTLETENLPVLKRIQDLPTGRQNPFHAEVYFINKTVQMSLMWGTNERIRFIEPNTGIPLDIGASGMMNLQVVDSKKILIKLVGTTKGIEWDKNDRNGENGFSQTLKKSFNPLIQTTIRTKLTSIIKQENIDILEIDERLDTLSEALRDKLQVGFEEYGLFIPQFYITGISLPEDNKDFQMLKKHRTEKLRLRDEEYEANMVAARRQREIERQKTQLEIERYSAEQARIKAEGEADAERYKGFAEAEVMKAKGFNQKDVLQADVQKEFAKGIGSMGAGSGGGPMSDVIGLGVGLAAMGQIGEQFVQGVKGTMVSSPKEVKGKMGNVNTVDRWSCSCGYSDNIGKFCSECGKPRPELWDCPSCGAKKNSGKYCSECGAKKIEEWDCTYCGASGNRGKFCSECGRVRKEETWDCQCGNKGISGNYCSECGAKKEDNAR